MLLGLQEKAILLQPILTGMNLIHCFMTDGKSVHAHSTDLWSFGSGGGAVGKGLLLTHLEDLALVLCLEAAVRLGWCLSQRPAGIHSIRKSYFTQHPCCIRNVRQG